MSKQERGLPIIIRQAVEEKKLKEEEVPKEAKELFVKYYNLLAGHGQEKVVKPAPREPMIRWEIPGIPVEADGSVFEIEVYTNPELDREVFHLPKKIAMIEELEPTDPWLKKTGPQAIVVSLKEKDTNKLVDELILNKEGKLSSGATPYLFLSFIVPRYEGLYEYLRKRLPRKK